VTSRASYEQRAAVVRSAGLELFEPVAEGVEEWVSSGPLGPSWATKVEPSLRAQGQAPPAAAHAMERRGGRSPRLLLAL
jgi:hypothetical protein